MRAIVGETVDKYNMNTGNSKDIFYFSSHESKVRPVNSVVHLPSDMFKYPGSDIEKVKM